MIDQLGESCGINSHLMALNNNAETIMIGNPPAGFWLRLVAKLIDGIVFAVMTFLVTGITLSILVVPTVLSHEGGFGISDLFPLLLWPLAACFVVGAIRHVWLLTSYRQATDGKRLLGIHITGENGKPVTRTQALIRFPALYLPFMLTYVFVQYSGLHMITQMAGMSGSAETQTLLKGYNDKIQSHQEPTTEERAAIERTMERYQDAMPSTANALAVTGLQLATIAYYLLGPASITHPLGRSVHLTGYEQTHWNR